MAGKDNSFAEFLRHERRWRKISLRELSEKTGISISYLNRLEKGERLAPSIQIVEKIASALEVPIADFLGVVQEDSKSPVSLAQLLYSNPFTLQGKLLSPEEKKRLLALIDFLSKLEWKKEKHKETLKLLELLDSLYT